MDLRRIKQVLTYGRLHANQIAASGDTDKSAMWLFCDILACYRKYRMWSNQYKKERFYALSKQQRDEIGAKYREEGLKRDRWQKDFQDNHRFLEKWTQFKYDAVKYRDKKVAAYTQRYNMGKGCLIEFDVHLTRQHYLDGTISIGDHVLLAKHVFIDYSGEVVIEDGVKLTNGVIIESHHRDIDAYEKGLDVNIPTSIRICEKAYIGSRAIILDSCNYIGKNARIGAGAVVTKDVPDNAVVAGVPAKVIRMLQ